MSKVGVFALKNLKMGEEKKSSSLEWNHQHPKLQQKQTLKLASCTKPASCSLSSEANKSHWDLYDADMDTKGEFSQSNFTPIHLILLHEYKQEEQKANSTLK